MKAREKNWKKSIVGLWMAIVLTVTGVFSVEMVARAETVKIGTVNVSYSLSFRNGPGTEYDIIGYLYDGQSGTILGQATATTGRVWYQMTVNGKTGWASSAYVTVNEVTIETDGDFESYLTSQGFPESYKPQLRALHQMYPNWQFQAQHTNLEWDDVIAAESKLGVNLVSSSSISSWKSLEDGAYDWETGKWVGLDSSSWVAASKGIIEYQMDPRNFLDSTYVFQFLLHKYVGNILTAADREKLANGLHSMVQGTYLAGNCDGKTYEQVLFNAADTSGVDPCVLASMLIQEQGRDGHGSSISGTVSGYEGYYNYFNIRAYPSGGYTAVQYGLLYAKSSGDYGRPWNTREKSIIGGASYYGSNYVSKGQDTIYLKKFNVQGSKPYTHQYMTNVQGAASEGRLLSNAFDATARQAKLIFKIPVYKNMPAEPCKAPTGNGSPNYMLKHLSVDGYSLTPSFDRNCQEYSLIVPYETDSVKVNATAYDTKATITGNTTVKLNVGNNDVAVVVKAENGDKRTYTIRIVRSDKPQEPDTTILTSTTFLINQNTKVLSGITEFPISASNLKNGLKLNIVGSVSVEKPDGSAQTGTVGTGDVIKVKDAAGNVKATYTIVIYGDTNGDGNIYATDYRLIKNQIMNGKKLTGFFATAADVNRDGKIQATDYVAIKNHIMEKSKISQ